MDDKAHIRLVDAHAERIGRAQDGNPVAQKRLLIGGARIGIHAGMIGKGGDAVFL